MLGWLVVWRCGLERRRCLRVGVELFKDLVGELGQVGLKDRESVGPGRPVSGGCENCC